MQAGLGPGERRVHGVQGRVEVAHGVVVAQLGQDVAVPAAEVAAVEEDAEHVRVTHRVAGGQGVQRLVERAVAVVR